MTRPLRILMTVDSVGGVWRYAMELGGALRPLGVETLFVGLGPAPSPRQSSEARAVGELEWLDQPLDWMADDAAQLTGIPDALERLVEQHASDLLHLNLPSQAVGLKSHRPAVVVTHSCMPSWWRQMRQAPLPPDWRWRKRLNEAGFRSAERVVAPSAAHAELTAATYGPIADIEVVHNGISRTFEMADKQRFVLAAGRWSDEGKNARLLDDAARDLEWPVQMAGALRGPDGQTAEVRFAHPLGAIEHSMLLEAMRAASIVASPSRYEPFGLAVLEGARCSAALALADIPTYRELWQDAALFFDPYDAAHARATLSRLIADRDLLVELGSRAIQRSWQYTADRQARRMQDIYRSAIGGSFPLAMTGT